MTRNFGLEQRHELPPTLDRRTRRRLLLISGMFCVAFVALAAVIVLMLTGVVS